MNRQDTLIMTTRRGIKTVIKEYII